MNGFTRMLRILFSKKMPRNDEVTRRIDAAALENERAQDSLLAVIRELLEENDKHTGRQVHVRKPRP